MRKMPVVGPDIDVRHHLEKALAELRTVDVSTGGSSDESRYEMLTVLEDYINSGQYPQNTSFAEKTPIFVDDSGTHCAVGHLLAADGRQDLVAAVSARHNEALVQDMDDDILVGLDQWASSKGFTRTELARIQPQYEIQPPTNDLLWLIINLIALLGAAMGFIAVISNRPKRWLVIATLALLATIGLWWTSAYWLLEYANFEEYKPKCTSTPCGSSPAQRPRENHLLIGLVYLSLALVMTGVATSSVFAYLRARRRPAPLQDTPDSPYDAESRSSSD